MAEVEQPEQPPAKQRARLQDLYLQVRDKPCRVVDVRVEPQQPAGGHEGGGGAQPGGDDAAKPLRLKQHILDRELDRVYDAATLKEVHEALERSLEVLRQLEVFEDVTGLISEEPLDARDACTVRLMVEEVGPYKLKAGTYTQGGEYSMEGSAMGRNLLGIADQWSITGEIGTRSSRNFAAAFRLPRAGGSGATPELRLLQAFNNQQLHSSWTEALRGVAFTVTSAEHPGLSLGYEYGWRSLSASPKASRSVQAQAGDYLKAALRGSCTWAAGGWERGEVLPTDGYQLQLAAELGGAAPGATSLRYSRATAHAAWAAALGDVLSFRLEAGTGVLLPCWAPGAGGRPSPLPERFYLGGVESNLRGFETRGVGPSEPRRGGGRSSGGGGAAVGGSAAAGASAGGAELARDALGGDLFGCLYAALLLRLPGQVGDLGVHAHAFANGGSSVLLSAGPGASSGGGAGGSGSSAGGLLRSIGHSLAGGVQQLGSSLRWSAGVGLVLPTMLGRFEANYCWVLTAQEHDRLKRGFSFGFAASTAGL